ncbi:MAG TPA: PVC-type heme-binding CxxCH protein [Verrucomicrobiales bacterium]|nr:PVC-type heme-binding CxxCH protein [Verrucomicrobiales bacterium]
MRLALAPWVVLLQALLAASLPGQGRQLDGVYTPAAGASLPPEEAQQRFQVPPGFEVRLFAAEPDVINPVGMCWDDRGRLWVVELLEYPLGAPEGQKPRDRVKVLEDTDRDGRADKVTVFADGLNLATGILVGNGGVYVGQAPDLLFFQDTDGDDVADRREVVLTGFGLEDRHELLNGFTWGPDGWLYMTHGVFTHSKVLQPGAAEGEAIIMNAAVGRMHPRTHRFEVFADGTSNPWGVDFDRHGHAFVSACVIDHMFHMAPGGLYSRQGGSPEHPYAYELLPSIVDHRHFRAAYAGIQVYEGHQFPESYRGSVFIGNIHGNTIHRDQLTASGASFVCSEAEDFLVANDGWFRPVSTQTGPDGALWIMDWHDKYPCYQNARADPEGVNREHGRIWRVVYTGDQPGAPVPSREPGPGLAERSTAELVHLLEHPNSWTRRTAQRLLAERQDPEAKALLRNLLASEREPGSRLAALWTLHAAAQAERVDLDTAAANPYPPLRYWAARLTGENREAGQGALARLLQLAADPEITVRSAVATACRQYASARLTINRPLDPALPSNAVLEMLILASARDADRTLAFLIWTAAEPLLARDPDWLPTFLPTTAPGELARSLAFKTARRLCDLNDASHVDTLSDFIALSATERPDLASAAIDGILASQEARALPPSGDTSELFRILLDSSDSAVLDRARQLGALWGDPAAMSSTLQLALSPDAAPAAREEAILALSRFRSGEANQTLLKILDGNHAEPLRAAAAVALARSGSEREAKHCLENWGSYPPAVRYEVAQALAARADWVRLLLDAIENSSIASSDLPVPVLRRLTNHDDARLRRRAEAVIGAYRETGADAARIIAEKKRMALDGPVDMEKGRLLTNSLCLTCHVFLGEGQEVGPDLTGSGRSNLDALLANIVDPNQIIGRGYEMTVVHTRDGRDLAGRLIEDNDSRVALLMPGGHREVVARADVESIDTSGTSLMPEGLWVLPDDDFRSLLWYILAPPEEGQELTAELRAQLAGPDSRPPEDESDAEDFPPIDRESVALWNPEWEVVCPDFEGTPARLTDYAGRRDVLTMHPFTQGRPAALERTLTIPAEGKSVLRFAVASHENGNWRLRVAVDGGGVLDQLVTRQDQIWREIAFDLTRFAGKEVRLRLENHANDWSWEFSYWQGLRLTPE